jgi:hypothetical protein
MRHVLRDFLKAAAGAATGVVGVAEEARRRAEGAARDLLELSGVHPNELLGRAPEPVQLVVGVVRSEADKVWSRLGDGVVQVGVVLEFLEQQVRHLQGEDDAPAAQPEEARVAQPRSEQAFPAPRRKPATARPVRVVVDEDLPVDDGAAAAARRRAAVPGMKKTAARKAAVAAEAAAPARTPAARKAPARKPAAAAAPVTAPASAEKAPARKAAARKTAAKRVPVKETAAKDVPAKKAAAKKAAKKTTTRAATQKSGTGQGATEQTPAKKVAAKKAPAKRATAAKRATTGAAPSSAPGVVPKAGAGAGDE